MVLDVNGEPLLPWDQAGPLCYRPAFHHTVHFQPQIVVQTGGGVLLDDESVASFSSLLAVGLRGRVEVALLAIGFECRHVQLALWRAGAAFALPAFDFVRALLGVFFPARPALSGRAAIR